MILVAMMLITTACGSSSQPEPSPSVQQSQQTTPDTNDQALPSEEGSAESSDALSKATGVDNAAFVSDVTIPDGTQITAGQSFTKTWRLKNSGTTTWTTSYKFCFVSGSQMSAPSCVNIGSSVAPNATYDVSVGMAAPTTAGSYTGYWKMKNASSVAFGTQVYVQITSVAPQDNSSFVSDVTIPDGTQITAGQSFTKTWRLKNTGGSTWTTSYKFCFVSGSQMSGPSCVNIGSSVAPNATYDVSVPMIAPSTAGSYTGYWKMKNASGTAFGTQVYVQITSVAPQDNSSFVSDVTIPDGTQVTAGQSFTKTWRIKNTGGTTWTTSYKFCFVSGSQMSGPSCVNIGSSVAPNATYDVSVPMVAPSTAGSYTGYWQMKNASSTSFGTQVYVQITSVAPQDNATFVSDVTIPDGTQVTAGQSFTKTWRIKNTGGTTWTTSYRFCFVSGSQMGAASCVNIGSSVAPNATYDVSVPMVAPSTAGSYTGYWQMKNASSTSFGTQVYVRITSVAPQDNAVFVTDVTIPDGTQVTAGQSFTKTWRIKNTGGTTWTTSYRFCFVSGAQMGAASCVNIGSSVAPNATYDVSVPMVAPTTAGSYTGYWQMKNASSTSFGTQVYVQITSVAPQDDAGFVSDVTIPDGTQVTAGQSFTKTWRLKNTGGTTWTTSYRFCFVSGAQMGAPSCVNIGSSVAPNATYDVSVAMTAPATAGSYTGYWQMKNAASTAFGTQVYVQINSVQPADSAQFVSETYGDGYQLSPYQNFTKRWIIKNNGASTWTTSYQFVHVSGTLSKNTANVHLSTSVAPGAQYVFDVVMQAPASGTNLEDHWKLVNASGTTIPVSQSSTIWAKVNVVTSYSAQWVSETVSDGTKFSPGTGFVKTWTIKNNGTSAWDSSFQLRRKSSAILSSISSLPVSGTVPVGSNYTFSISMKAPANAGTYQEDWEFVGPANEIIQIRAADNSWSTSKIWAMISVNNPTTPPDGIQTVDTDNPTYKEISDEILNIAAIHDIPPVILKAIAFKESGWRQYWDADGSQTYCGGTFDFAYAKGDAKYGYDTDATCSSIKSIGIGIMQITIPVSGDVSDRDNIEFSDATRAQAVSGSWKTNIEKAVEKLNDRWATNIAGVTSECDLDKRIVENWYYPIAWYNGTGGSDGAYGYVGDIYDYISGDLYTNTSVDPYMTKISDISSPQDISTFPTIIYDNNNTPYYLADLVDAGGKIHKWTGGDVYADITSDVSNGLCESSTGSSSSPLTKVAGVVCQIGVAQSEGRNVTVRWQQNPVDQHIQGYIVAWKEYSSPTWNYSDSIGPMSTADNTLSWTHLFAPGSYEVRVVLNSNDGLSSDKVGFSIAAESNKPAVVTGMNHTVSGNSVTISWNASQGATFYMLKSKKSGDARDTSTLVGGTSATVASLANGSYEYKLNACVFAVLPFIVCSADSETKFFDISESGVSGDARDYCARKELRNNKGCRDIEVKQDDLLNYSFTLNEDVDVLTVQIAGVGKNSKKTDVDLYLKQGSEVTQDDVKKLADLVTATDKDPELDETNPVLVAPYLEGSLESVTIYNAKAGKWYVGLNGSNIEQTTKIDLRLRYNNGQIAGYPANFKLDPTGSNTRIFSPMQTDLEWYTVEGKCANGESSDADGEPCSGDDGFTWDSSQAKTDHLYCLMKKYPKNCVSQYHVKGDFDSLDWNVADDADAGSDALAGFSGVVVFSGAYDGFGNEVIIQSDIDSNFTLRYAHLQAWDKDNPQPAIGKYVEVGEKIGQVGGTGGLKTWPNHLHLSLHRNVNLNAASGGDLNESKQMLSKVIKGQGATIQSYSAFIPVYYADYLTPTETNHTVVELACPVDSLVTDASGRRSGVGPFGTFNDDIPEVDYHVLKGGSEEVEVVSIANAGVGSDYRIDMIGKGSGYFDLGISSPNKDTSSIENIVFLGQPVDSTTIATVMLDELAGAYPMSVTNNESIYQPEPSGRSANADQYAGLSPKIDSISPRVLTPGETVTIRGRGFGNMGESLPGTIDLILGVGLYRPFNYTSWSDTELVAQLKTAVPEGHYQLRLMIYPSRLLTNLVDVSVVASGSVPHVSHLQNDYALANEDNRVVTVFGSGFTSDAVVTIGGQMLQNSLVADSTYIEGNLPRLAAGAYQVSVANGAGATSNGDVVITYLDGDADLDADGMNNRDEIAYGTKPNVADTDLDGHLDGVDAFPLDPSEYLDTDKDGIGNNEDDDDDDDGVPDSSDAFPLDPNESQDADKDGVGDNSDSNVRLKDASGRTIYYKVVYYDAGGNITRSIVYDDYTYDEKGRSLGYTLTNYGASGNVTSTYSYEQFTYADSNRYTGYWLTISDGAGNVTIKYEYFDYTYYANGVVSGYKRRDYNGSGALQRQLEYTYNEKGKVTGNVSTTYDSNGAVTQSYEYSNYAYDELGRVMQYDRADYDAAGNLVRRFEYRDYQYYSSGKTQGYVRYDYDANNKLVTRTTYTFNEKGAVLTNEAVSYDANGLQTSRRLYSNYLYDDQGRTLQYDRDDFDASDSLTARVEVRNYTYGPQGKVSSYELSNFGSDGNLVNRYEYEFDDAGRRTVLGYTTYDSAGNSTGGYRYSNYLYDEKNRATQYDRENFDGSGNLVSKSEVRNYSYGPEGKVSSYELSNYGSAGQLLNLYQYEFDSSGRVSSMRLTTYDAAGNSTGGYRYSNYLYDEKNRATQYDRENFDASGNLVSKSEVRNYSYGPEGKVSSYELSNYGPAGQLLNRYQYEFNSSGRTSAITFTSYDSAGNPSGGYRYSNYLYDEKNRTTQYDRENYDASGNVVSRVEVRNYSYGPEGKVNSYELSNYGPAGQLLNLYQYEFDSSGHTSVLRYTSYDSAGAISGGYRNSNYLYDEKNRVTQYDRENYGALDILLYKMRYRNFVYDSTGVLMSYDWEKLDASGNVLSSGQWKKPA